ncbi:non-specific lipid transfer protein GPI-anchored 6-like [Benincasa hispida]|uniref:non-specific lipid transfer protein GPI-anchored 6-like n=1 Tax=Benincasa hispida TaxID=102211 RepID=UPI0019021732|nr:non-specific lipid transfer protein GPI-anchored 6-like [Benincasa hispida]
MASNLAAFSLFCNFLLLLASFAASNIDQDRTECSDQLTGLAPCLPYVSGDAKTPTIDCCSGLKQVVQKSKKCLCVLIKDKDDPNLGLKINGSLALALPNDCHAPANITECISLLHLSPNSTEAKIFKESNPTSGPSSSPDTKVHGSSSTANEKSDGGMGKRWIGSTEMIMGILLGFFILSHLNLMFI